MRVPSEALKNSFENQFKHSSYASLKVSLKKTLSSFGDNIDVNEGTVPKRSLPYGDQSSAWHDC